MIPRLCNHSKVKIHIRWIILDASNAIKSKTQIKSHLYLATSIISHVSMQKQTRTFFLGCSHCAQLEDPTTFSKTETSQENLSMVLAGRCSVSRSMGLLSSGSNTAFSRKLSGQACYDCSLSLSLSAPELLGKTFTLSTLQSTVPRPAHSKPYRSTLLSGQSHEGRGLPDLQRAS